MKWQQCRSHRQIATVGPASDLYALAVVAFEALTGRRPFQGKTMADYAELHCHAQVPSLGGSFPPALDQMFQRALAKRPAENACAMSRLPIPRPW